MPSYAGPSSPTRPGEVADTLRLLAYLVAALVLVVLDHRGGWLNQTRQQATVVVQPLRMVAGWPGRMAEKLHYDAGTLSQLTVDNERLRNEALVNNARMARLQTVAVDNARLRGLLDAAQRGGLDVQLAPILDIDLDPTRQRLLLDAGSGDGVSVGQSVIDAGGLLGQVIDTTPMHATVLLLTDVSHAVPVAVARNGVRLIAYGTGSNDLLRLASIPLSSDVKVGDRLVTSGLGGRFPAGFPVGTVAALRPDDSRAFLLGDVTPAAQLDRGRDVLLLRSVPVEPARDSGIGIRDSEEAKAEVVPVSAGTAGDASRSAPPLAQAGGGWEGVVSAATLSSDEAESPASKAPLPNPPLPRQGRGQEQQLGDVNSAVRASNPIPNPQPPIPAPTP